MRVKGKMAALARKVEQHITSNTLCELFNYNADTGALSCAITGRDLDANPSPQKRYKQVAVAGVRLSQHRVIHCMMTGRWPEHEVDHINGDPRDNRWANLRPATAQQNNQWSRKRPGKTGHVGVVERPNGKFRARIGGGCRGNRIHVGDFASLDDAVRARNELLEGSN